jgi:ribonuclease BN (tRNA processing enzyme)
MNEKSIILTVLGSGTAIPYQNRVSASYLVQSGNLNILLDAGFNVGYRLDDIGIRVSDLDYIFLTHKHPDHFMGIIHLLFQLKLPFFNRSKPLKIIGFKGLNKYLLSLQHIIGKWIKPNCEIEIIEEEKFRFPKFEYSLYNTVHTEESVAVKINLHDKIIFYTSDTEYFKEISYYAEEADILIAECAASEGLKLQGHMDYIDAVKIAKQAKVNKLLLSHFYPESNNFKIFNPDFAFQLFKARDLMKIIV